MGGAVLEAAGGGEEASFETRRNGLATVCSQRKKLLSGAAQLICMFLRFGAIGEQHEANVVPRASSESLIGKGEGIRIGKYFPGCLRNEQIAAETGEVFAGEQQVGGERIGGGRAANKK